MAYGDTGMGGEAKGWFAAIVPWTDGQVIGVDKMGQPLPARDRKCLLDTGATLVAAGGETVKDMRVTNLGAVVSGQVAGVGVVGLFTGVSFKFRVIKGGNPVDLTYSGRFGIAPVPPGVQPPQDPIPVIFGTDLFLDQKVTVTANFDAKTVALAG